MALVKVWIALVFAVAVGGQPPLKQWAGADEYNLGSQALAEPDLNQKLKLLEDWVARYPKTEFERERLISFVLVLQRLGRTGESLSRATEALALNANDPSVLLLIAALGPTLPSASESQIATVADSALKLLSIRISQPAAVVSAQSQSAIGPEPFLDPETQRVIAFVRELRAGRDPAVQRDPEVVKRQVAEAALRWAKNARR